MTMRHLFVCFEALRPVDNFSVMLGRFPVFLAHFDKHMEEIKTKKNTDLLFFLFCHKVAFF